MTNFIRDTDDPFTDKVSDPRPYNSPTTQWGKADANAVFTAMRDIKGVIRGDSFNAKNYGAVGDGVADDSTAINAAMQAAKATTNGVFGGIVDLPKGTYICKSQLVVPNGVALRGAGGEFASTIIRAHSTFNAASLVRNESQDGTQEAAGLIGIYVDGNQGAGAVCSTAVVDLIGLFVPSVLQDVVVTSGSNVGLRIGAAGTPGGAGPIKLDTIWCVNNVGHNLMVEEVAGNTGAFTSVVGINVTLEHQGSGKSALYIKGLGNAGQFTFRGLHIEQGAGATGRTCITLDGVSDVDIKGLTCLGIPSTVSEVVKITTAIQNLRFEIGPIFNPNLLGSSGGSTFIRNLKTGDTVGPNNLFRYVTPDSAIVGGQRFTPATGTTGIGWGIQDTAGTDRTWSNASGQLTGSSINGAAVDLVGDATNNRPLMLVPSSVSGLSNVYGFFYPSGGGGVVNFRSFTGGADVFQVGTGGTLFVHQTATFQLGLKGQAARAAAPSSGTHVQGEVVFNADPIASGFIGWVCVTGGTPGTWKSWGAISP